MFQGGGVNKANCYTKRKTSNLRGREEGVCRTGRGPKLMCMISQSLSFAALSPADWPRDLPFTALPPGLCKVQTVGRWRQGEEGVSSVVFSLRHSRHGSTRQETKTLAKQA